MLNRDEWMKRTGPLYPGLVALCQLTAVPLPRGLEPTDDDISRSTWWFPAVGVLIGTALAALAWILRATNLVAAVAAVAVIAAAVAATRARHELGFARTADSLIAARDVLPASGLSAVGILALNGLVAVRGVGLMGTDTTVWTGALITSQATAAWAMLLLLKLADPRPDQGRGYSSGATLATASFSWTALVVTSAIVAVVGIWFGGFRGLVAVLAAGAAVYALSLLCQRRFGGVDGPFLTATAATSEFAVLLVFAASYPAANSPWVMG